MSDRSPLFRKIVYFCIIVMLLLPLSWLSQPQSLDASGKVYSGGKLAQERAEHDLSQAELGEIDPTSEAMRLATLGMRGIAANILWEKANYYKKVEDWTSVSATVEQITKLQPNFIAIWDFQAHNLSYNISAEFDDYRDRYYWVVRGVKFLIDGTRYNKYNPLLLSRVGWYLTQKIGRSDEHEQFRKMFKTDDDLHELLAQHIGPRSGEERDNWLTGREWFLKAQTLVDTYNVPVKGSGEVIFHSQPAMALINYSDTIEEEGTFGEKAREAWRRAGVDWFRYGSRDLPDRDGKTVQLNQMEQLQERADELKKQLDGLDPGLRERIVEQKRAKLPSDARRALEIAPLERTVDQERLAAAAQSSLEVTHREVAAEVPTDRRDEARQLVRDLERLENTIRSIDTFRDIVNFNYWRTRCEMEQTEDALAARQLIYEAQRDHREVRLERAKDLYEQAWQKWRSVFDKFPNLKDDFVTTDDIKDMVIAYREVLDQLELKFPEKFILQDVLDKNSTLQGQPPQGDLPSSANKDDSKESSADDSAKPQATGAAANDKGSSTEKGAEK